MSPEAAILGIALALIVGVGAGFVVGRNQMKQKVREIKSEARDH